MKKGNIIKLTALVLIAACVVLVLFTCSPTKLFCFEKNDATSGQASYLYLDETRTYTIEIDSLQYGCLEVSTNDGSFLVEITDAAGNEIYDDASNGGRTFLFHSETDVTIKFTGVEHSGSFRFWFSSEPIY